MRGETAGEASAGILQYELSPRTKAIVIAGTMLALFVSAVDQTVVSTALPRIIAELGGLSLFTWVFTSYMLASTTVVPVIGKLSDLYGRKPFLMAGIVVFTVASTLNGASQTIMQLIVFRAFQGIGAGMIMATSFAVIGDLYSPAERGKFMGLFAATFGLASVFGPTLGGYITDNLSWRWVFYVNIPFGFLALAVLAVGFPWVRRPPGERYVDYWGVTALTLAVVPLLLALVWAGDVYPWLSPQIAGLLAFSALMALAFVFVENFAKEPLMPLQMFRNQIFVVAVTVTFLTGIGMFGSIVFMPWFIQGALGASATSSGVVNTPMMLGLVVAATISGQLVSRVGHYRLLIVLGGVVLAAGMYLLTLMNENTAQTVAVRNMVVIGVGLGLSLPLLTLVVQNALPYQLLGVATSTIQFFRSIGGTLGIAVFGTIVTSQIRAGLRAELPPDVTATVPPELITRLEDPQILLSPSALDRLREAFAALGPDGPRLFTETVSSMRAVLAGALVDVFFAGFLVAILALLVSVFIRELPLRTAVEMRTAPSERLAGLKEEATSEASTLADPEPAPPEGS